MSYGLQFSDEDNIYDLCSASQWTEFAEWAEKCPFPHVKQLANGECDSTARLSAELSAVDTPLAKRIRGLIGTGADDESCRIVDEEG